MDLAFAKASSRENDINVILTDSGPNREECPRFEPFRTTSPAWVTGYEGTVEEYVEGVT